MEIKVNIPVVRPSMFPFPNNSFYIFLSFFPNVLINCIGKNNRNIKKSST